MNPEVSIKIEVITPEQAKRYLNRNCRNRRLNKGVVRFYASEMKAGNWMCALAAAITFDWNGNLQDGQHRLKAVIESGRAIKFYVKRGANPDDFPYIDMGKGRGANDAFYISEIPNAEAVSAAIKKYLSLKEGHSSILNKLGNSTSQASKGYKNIYTPKFLMEVYRENPDFWQKTANFSKRIHRVSKLFNPSFIGGLYAYLILEKANSADIVSRFFEELAGQTNNTGIILFRNALIEDLRKPSYLRMREKFKQKLTAFVWNHFRLGKKIRSLRFDDEAFIDFD